MFSPSLITMMFHDFDPEARINFQPSTYKTTADIADHLKHLLSKFGAANRFIPVVARSRKPPSQIANAFPKVTIRDSDPAQFFWGRIPLDRLIQHFINHHAEDPNQEYLDLGTPLVHMGSVSKYDQTCASLLPKSASKGMASVGTAIVDLGEHSPSAPDDYGGHLRHAVTSAIKLSDHAEQVLSVLLQRLDANGVLSNTTVSCALVRPAPAIGVGLECFEQASASEMLDAVNDIEPQLSADGLPCAINMSLGTHVGPHNGVSPLEEFLSMTLIRGKTFLVAAAGNEGGAGNSCKRSVQAGENEFVSIRTGQNCKEMLVEFWWKDNGGTNVWVDADIRGITSAGALAHYATVRIDPASAGTTLVQAPAGLPSNMIMHSLFSARCRNSFSCIAFAISATWKAPLPLLQIRVTLHASQDTIVNGWIVVSEVPSLTSFVEGGPDGTIAVPATDPTVLSVAGLDSKGAIWQGSSRGPAAQYDVATPGSGSPLMAHLGTLGGTVATSFASPRACADAVAALADSAKLQSCVDAQSLLQQAYGLTGTLAHWNPRYGYHKQTK